MSSTKTRSGILTFVLKPCPSLSPPTALSDAIRTTLVEQNKHNPDPDAHPEALRNDIEALERMRREWVEGIGNAGGGGGGGDVHQSTRKGLICYHAQLVFTMTKFPSDLNLPFPWYPCFSSPSTTLSFTPVPGAIAPQSAISYPNLQYERCCVLFNIAAMTAALAGSEDLSKEGGIKLAINQFQVAAGIFNHLLSSALPSLRLGPKDPDPPSPDLSKTSLEALTNLCLAQAQECAWKKAVDGGTMKSGVIARLAQKVADYYTLAWERMTEAKGAGGAWPGWSFPTDWVNHVNIKRHHFAAAAQYRKSCDDMEARRYGDELGRLEAARESVRKAKDSSKKGVNELVLADLRSLQAKVDDNYTRANKDNDLIYLQPITSPANLPPINAYQLVNTNVPPEIEDPISALHEDRGGLGRPLFQTLVPYGVHLAISVYEDRKDSLIRDEVEAKIDELDAIANSTLQSLNLPGSIQALEAPVSLPPSLLRKAEEVRREGGPTRIRAMINDIAQMAKSDRAIWDESEQMLNQEEAEDNNFRSQFGTDQWTRAPSQSLNQALRDHLEKYRQTLEGGANGDASVREKFKQWEDRISALALEEEDLQRAVPSASIHESRARGDTGQLSIVRELRRQLETLEDHRDFRRRLLEDAKRTASVDDIRPAVIRTAAKLTKDTPGYLTIESAQFEDLFESQLTRYREFRESLEENAAHQDGLLEEIRVTNQRFLDSRKDDPNVRRREEALQTLDVAHSMYRELMGNLTEGLRFYNNFAGLLNQLRDACREFAQNRQVEAQEHSNTISMQRIQLQPGRYNPDVHGPIRFG